MKEIALVPLMMLAIFAFRPFSKTTNTAVVQPVNKFSLPFEPTVWKLDKTHSNVIFSVSHLVVSDVEGRFNSFDGMMESSKPDFSDAKISFTVEVSSISTDNENRDNHLKSDDFFNAAKFSQMKFVSKSFEPLGNNKYKLTGDLTIRDITKPVVFDVTYGGMVNAMGGTHVGFKAKTSIDRFDFNLKWDKTTEAGGLVVGKNIDITINIDMKKV